MSVAYCVDVRVDVTAWYVHVASMEFRRREEANYIGALKTLKDNDDDVD